jgi:hypothetical protein
MINRCLQANVRTWYVFLFFSAVDLPHPRLLILRTSLKHLLPPGRGCSVDQCTMENWQTCAQVVLPFIMMLPCVTQPIRAIVRPLWRPVMCYTTYRTGQEKDIHVRRPQLTMSRQVTARLVKGLLGCAGDKSDQFMDSQSDWTSYELRMQ